MHTCIHACMHTCTYAYMHICTYILSPSSPSLNNPHSLIPPGEQVTVIIDNWPRHGGHGPMSVVRKNYPAKSSMREVEQDFRQALTHPKSRFTPAGASMWSLRFVEKGPSFVRYEVFLTGLCGGKPPPQVPVSPSPSPSHSLTHLLTHLLTYLLTHLLTYLLTYLLTHLPAGGGG